METKESVKQLIKTINNIPFEERGHVVSHDLNAVFQPIRVIVQSQREKKHPTFIDDIKDVPSGIQLSPQLERRRLMYGMERCKEDLEYAKNIPLSDISEVERRLFIDTLPDTYAIFPALEAEMLLLAKPTIDNYERLLSVKVELNAILRRFGAQQLPEDRDINGLRAIQSINLAGNARKYLFPGTEITARLLEAGQLEIGNFSQYPFTDDLWNLGVKGPCGNRGIGLHLVDVLSRVSGDTVSYECKQIEDELYDIKFLLPLGDE